MKRRISIGKGTLWVIVWVSFMVSYSIFNIAVWRSIAPGHSEILNIITIALCMVIFLTLLVKKTGFKLNLFANITIHGTVLAIGCSILFYFLLDKGLDPLFERIFPSSKENHQRIVQLVKDTPIISLLDLCILFPFFEETLMRGFLLGGLSANYGKFTALLVSAALFAVLHFDIAQIIPSFICGLILGLLYFRTASIFSCVLAHMGYNLISYIIIFKQ